MAQTTMGGMGRHSASGERGGAGPTERMREPMQRVQEPMRRMWGSAWASAIGGLALLVLGATRRTWLGKLLGIGAGAYAGVHAVQVARGGGTKPEGAPGMKGFERVAGMMTRARNVRIEQSVRVDASPNDVYTFVRDFRNLKRFMSHVHDVREDADGRIHWVWNVPMGMRLEEDARVVDDDPGRVITWASTEDEPFEETGTVLFEPMAGGTQVTMRLSWAVPGGPTGMMAARMIESYSERIMRDELNELKTIIEARTPAMAGYTSGSPTGRGPSEPTTQPPRF